MGEDNRLRDADRGLLRDRMVDLAASWVVAYRQTGGSLKASPAGVEVLVRVGLGAICCSQADMRDCELAEIRAIADQVMAEAAGP